MGKSRKSKKVNPPRPKKKKKDAQVRTQATASGK